MTRELILEARGVHAWYGSSHVLQGIDLQIARGESIGLLGRNGMGKSTLIRTLLGHVKQREGRIVIAGEDVSRARPHQVARLGVAYVPEGRGVFPNLTVRENLVMAARRGRAVGRSCLHRSVRPAGRAGCRPFALLRDGHTRRSRVVQRRVVAGLRGLGVGLCLLELRRGQESHTLDRRERLSLVAVLLTKGARLTIYRAQL